MVTPEEFKYYRLYADVVEDSGRSTDGFDFEDLREQIVRRKLLLGAVAIGGGSIFLTQSESPQQEETDDLAEAESQFVEMAGRINGADLVDPQETSLLYDGITHTVRSVTEILDQYNSEEPQTEQRIAALSAAVKYYNTLVTTLDAGFTLLTQVADSEIEVLNHQRNIEYDPVAAPGTERFEESIVRLSQVETSSEPVSENGKNLVPNPDQVVESLRAQHNLFDRHLTAQQTYLNTAKSIEAGIRAFEQSKFDTARTKLNEAHESLSAGTPQTGTSYRLSNAGLALDQYVTLLDLRREGVSKLIDVCDDSVPEQQRRAVANTALDHLFEARRVVTN